MALIFRILLSKTHRLNKNIWHNIQGILKLGHIADLSYPSVTFLTLFDLSKMDPTFGYWTTYKTKTIAKEHLHDEKHNQG